jgi:hypothetical protein
MIRTRQASIIRSAIRHAKANHGHAALTAVLARAYGWPAHVTTHATLEALQAPPPPGHAKDELYVRAYKRTLRGLPRIKVHHPGCGCGPAS